MISVILASEGERPKWQEYLRSLKCPAFYHDYRWKYVIERSSGRKPFYLMAIQGDKVCGLFPLFLSKNCIMGSSLISLPFLNYGGLLADQPEAAAALLKEAQEILKRNTAFRIELRHLEHSDQVPFTLDHKVTFWLDLLLTADEQWKAVDPKIRNQVRKAEKSGLTVRSGKDDLLNEFYQVFCRNMRDLGTPVLGKDFFENILEYFQAEAHIFVIEHKRKPIAAAFTLVHNQVMEIPWASSIRSFNALCPSMLLYWQVIKSAISMGCHRFDFGRCSKGSGTYNFKKQWGAKAQQLYWQYWAPNGSDLPAVSAASGRLGLVVKIWQRLPLWVTNKVGPWIARTLPTF